MVTIAISTRAGKTKGMPLSLLLIAPPHDMPDLLLRRTERLLRGLYPRRDATELGLQHLGDHQVVRRHRPRSRLPENIVKRARERLRLQQALLLVERLP